MCCVFVYCIESVFMLCFCVLHVGVVYCVFEFVVCCVVVGVGVFWMGVG